MHLHNDISDSVRFYGVEFKNFLNCNYLYKNRVYIDYTI